MKFFVLPVVLLLVATFGNSESPLTSTPGTKTAGFGLLSVVYWNPVTQDVNGTVEAAVTYELAIAINGVDMNDPTAKAVKVIPSTKPELPIGQYLYGLPLGIHYRVFIRAIDAVGNKSIWSNYIQGPIDLWPPFVPAGAGHKLRMIVDVLEVQK
jgi:hypothetical protein